MKNGLFTRITALFFAVLMTFALLPAAAMADSSDEYPVYVVTEETSFYSNADTGSKAIRSMFEGEEVLYLGRSGSFYHVMDKKLVKGYVRTSAVEYNDYDISKDNFAYCPVYAVWTSSGSAAKHYPAPGRASNGKSVYNSRVLIINEYSPDLYYVLNRQGKFFFIKAANLINTWEYMTFKELTDLPGTGITPIRSDWNGDDDEVYTIPSHSNRPYFNCNDDLVVACTSRKYIYMYSEPSSTKGKNLGSYKNGTHCKFLSWSKKDEWCKVRFGNKVGYVRYADLEPAYRYY